MFVCFMTMQQEAYVTDCSDHKEPDLLAVEDPAVSVPSWLTAVTRLLKYDVE